MLILKSFGVGIIIALLAIILGIVRTKFILPALGDLRAHQVGTVMFLITQFVVIYLFVRYASITSTIDLLTIGIFWVVLTILFEFIFGHYVVGHPWSKLLADYNIFKGRLWVLVLINNLVAPLISGRLLK